MKSKNGFGSKGVLRTPLLPFENIQKDLDGLKKLAKDQLIQESILLASPAFHQELNKWLNSDSKSDFDEDRIQQSLYKYLARMSTRSTPFGLLGTIAYAEFEENDKYTDFRLNDSVYPQVRLDICAVQELINWFANQPLIRNFMKYGMNNSIYKLGDDYRYFEPISRGREILFELSKVTANPILAEIQNYTAEELQPFDDIVSFCTDLSGFKREDVANFLYQLIDAGMLTGELNIYLSETNGLKTLIKRVEEIIMRSGEGEELISYLNVLKELDLKLINSEISVSEKHQYASNTLSKFGLELNSGDLIQVDTTRIISEDQKVNINLDILKQLQEARDILIRLTPKPTDRFKQFKEDFTDRYGEREMPLLQVVDPEAGIGYMQKSEDGDDSALLNGLNLNSEIKGQSNITLSPVEQFLLKKVIAANQNQLNEVDLSNEELNQLPLYETPGTQSVRVSVFDRGDLLQLHEFSNSSAINRFSRFTWLDKGIHDLCKEIHEFESTQEKGATIAEIIHLPELKSGNIVLHEKVRQAEIPCVNLSANNDQSETIKLDDINVKITLDRQVVLLSKKTGQRIIPKLSNSLNYDRDGINSFRFLADLQFQNELESVYFNWYGLLPLFDHFPRVKYKNVILSPAFWVVEKDELHKANSIENWLKQRKIPKRINLASNPLDDYQLFIDFSNPLAVKAFRTEVEKQKKVYLLEIPSVKTPVKSPENKTFLNELILPYFNSERNTIARQSHSYSNEAFVENHFLPGSKWLYVKVYMGHVTANRVLSEIARLADAMVNSGEIKKWFFIRYSDGDYHLRFRFELNDPKDATRVLSWLNDILEPELKNDVIHNIVVDTYKREIDRYGEESINYCEEIFGFDSQLVSAFIQTENQQDDWLLAAAGIDTYLNDFGYTLEEKTGLMTFIVNQFFKEFRITRKPKLELDKKYRNCRNDLFQVMKSFGQYKEMLDSDLLALCKQRSQHVTESVKGILNSKDILDGKLKKDDIVLSLLHMFLNRLFTSNPRKQEMVVYYLMYKHYKAVAAIKA